MPKGVEHQFILWAVSVCVLSVESLMPKGVEHIFARHKNRFIVSVESLMPKGVEHETIK